VTKKWNKELLLGKTSITEAMRVSEIGSCEEVEEKRSCSCLCLVILFIGMTK
jgi:hypothetical protein